MEQIQTLLYDPLLEQKTEAASTIITNYDLPFNTDDIVKAFEYLQIVETFHRRCASSLMHLSLTTNLRMFIAIMYSLCNRKTLIISYDDLVTRNGESYILGCQYDHDFNVKSALKSWVALYDYYEFDISELALSDRMREGLEKHVNSKARYTKKAIK